MREKMKKPMEDTHEEDVSFMDNYLIFKFIAVGSLTLLAAFKGNQYMQSRMEERRARRDGDLDAYIEEKDL